MTVENAAKPAAPNMPARNPPITKIIASKQIKHLKIRGNNRANVA